MSQTETTAPQRQVLTYSAEEIGKRFLKLIASLDTRTDITPERIEQYIGVPLPPVRPGELGASLVSEEIGNGWNYGIVYYPQRPGGLASIGLSFDHYGDQQVDASAICTLDFDYYHNAMVEMGFVAQQYYGEHNLFLGWRRKLPRQEDISKVEHLAG